MKKVILSLIVFWTTFCCAGTVDDLKQFYKTYIRYELEDKKAEAISLKKRVLSPACFEKLARVTAITNSNPLLRAQDVNNDMLESIHVEEIGNDWFVVSYYWDMTRRSTLQMITLKARRHDNGLIIEYVTPVWSRLSSGDITIRGIDTRRTCTNTGLDFLRSFYSQYLSIYCDMEDKVFERIEDLCKQYCTERAIKEIQDKQEEYRLDGDMNYDPFIDGFDFDVGWYESLTVRQVEESYSVRYFDGNIHYIDISLIKKGNQYFIDHIYPHPQTPINPNFTKPTKR